MRALRARPPLPPRAAALAIAACAISLEGHAQSYPLAELSNGAIEATIYLPDPERGYYRGTRFEWAGVFGRLEYEGRNYAARWYEPHDPRRHDSLGGPIQEFVVDGRDNAGLGYGEAKPGETFVKVGVGVLRKPDEEAFRFSREYEIVDHGRWTVRTEPWSVSITHDLADPRSGYAYRYTKVVRLDPERPTLTLEHRLENVGSRPIETSVYNHNFLVMDDRPSGPELAVTFPFALNVTRTGPLPILEVRGGRLTFQRSLREGESVRYEFDGFGDAVASHDFRVESTATGRGVRITGDRPLSHLVFWSVPRVISPEAYLRMRIAPGDAESWVSRYTFYPLPAAAVP